MGILANGFYQKKPGEDLQSIINGITRYKGKIHLSVGKPVNSYLEKADKGRTTNDKITRLAGMIDSEIYSHYKLWPNNYIAFDALNSNKCNDCDYSPADAEDFKEYMAKETHELSGERKSIDNLFLKLYANPVMNSMHALQHEIQG